MQNILLPAIPAQAGLPATIAATITQVKHIEKYIAAHRKLNPIDVRSRDWSQRELAQAKQLLTQLDGHRQVWACLNQPATPDEIGTVVAVLIGGFTNLTNTDTTVLAQLLIMDITGEEPSVYMLWKMRQAVRLAKFLGTDVVIKELGEARLKGKYIHLRLTIPLLERAIMEAELQAEHRQGEITEREYNKRRDQLPRCPMPLWVATTEEPK